MLADACDLLWWRSRWHTNKNQPVDAVPVTILPNRFTRVDRETLEREFLNLAAAEGVSDVEDVNRILEQAGSIADPLKVQVIDDETLAKITGSQQPDTVKVFNLLKSLHATIEAKQNTAEPDTACPLSVYGGETGRDLDGYYLRPIWWTH